MPFFKAKRDQDVEFEELKKGSIYKIKIKETIIVAFRLPELKHFEVKGEAGTDLSKFGAAYQSGEQAIWEIVIKEADLPLRPYNAWKETCAEVLSRLTRSSIQRDDTRIYGVSPVIDITICPHCGAAAFTDSPYCQRCGSLLFEEKYEEMKCDKCGFVNSPSAKFCRKCGQNLS